MLCPPQGTRCLISARLCDPTMLRDWACDPVAANETQGESANGASGKDFFLLTRLRQVRKQPFCTSASFPPRRTLLCADVMLVAWQCPVTMRWQAWDSGVGHWEAVQHPHPSWTSRCPDSWPRGIMTSRHRSIRCFVTCGQKHS